MVLLSSGDVQAAFRAGVRGRPLADAAGNGLAEAPAGYVAGANAALAHDLDRLPGLSDPDAAFATGRAVRRIMALFDQARAPVDVGRQFLDNLRSAAIGHHVRPGSSWGAAETVAMFMEMYGRVHGTDGRDFSLVETSLLEDALGGANGRGGGGLVGALRRLRRSG